MKRTLVVSDIHGELNKFTRLLENVNYNPESDQLILLGDYIDRGPDSALVLDKVMELKSLGALVLKGNHEDMMARAFSDSNQIKHWIRNGGIETLVSYGYSLESNDLDELVLKLSPLNPTEKVNEHLAFIDNLDFYVETDDCIFVHGGVDPKTPLSETDSHVLIWIRDEFHQGYNGDKTVIFGHTPTNNFHDGHDIYFGENRIIGVDGGCVYGGQLNCLELPGHICHHIK